MAHVPWLGAQFAECFREFFVAILGAVVTFGGLTGPPVFGCFLGALKSV